MEFMTEERTTLQYEMPLAEVVTDFFDELKSRSKGYASMDYQFLEYREEDLVKLEIKINGEIAEPLAAICHRYALFCLIAVHAVHASLTSSALGRLRVTDTLSIRIADVPTEVQKPTMSLCDTDDTLAWRWQGWTNHTARCTRSCVCEVELGP